MNRLIASIFAFFALTLVASAQVGPFGAIGGGFWNSTQTCANSSVNATALMHFDGSNGSTSTIDVYGHTITSTNAQLSTTQKKFGATSATTTASTAGNGFIIGSGSTDFAFSTGDFTVDFWYYANATDAAAASVIVGIGSDAGGLWFRNGAANKLTIYWNSAATTGTATLTTSAWHHLAASRVGSSVRIFVDGALDQTLGAATHSNTTGVVAGGRNAGSATVSISTSGFVDELRVLKGTGYWSAAFTPNTFPWCN